MAQIGINDDKFFISVPLWPSAFGQLAGGAFLRLDSLRAQIVQTQKSPSGQLPEGRRPKGHRNVNQSDFFDNFDLFLEIITRLKIDFF